MDLGVQHSDDDIGFEDAEEEPRHRALPSDLPKSLDDRQPVRQYAGETEMYDAWQGSFTHKAMNYRRDTTAHRSIRSIAIPY